MASEITGLQPLHGYLKNGNLVVRMGFPYIELPDRQPKFIQRAMKTELKEELKAVAARGGSEWKAGTENRAAGSEADARAATTANRVEAAALFRVR